jgi:hypothetical protein
MQVEINRQKWIAKGSLRNVMTFLGKAELLLQPSDPSHSVSTGARGYNHCFFLGLPRSGLRL